MIHSESRRLPYAPEQLFQLVADVERYPEFLPWCVAARVAERRGNIVTADLVIGFRMIRERFRSRVELTAPSAIAVSGISGPFRRLDNRWSFRAMPNGQCEIDFLIDYEFRSRLLQVLIGAFFQDATKRIVGAFESRAERLFRAPAGALPAALS